MLTGTRTHRATCPCGWEGWYSTPGYACKAKTRHTCGDYSPRECGRHEHGQPAHYKHCGCRCWPCRLALLDEYDASTKARAYGRQRFVDATTAREHVRALMDAGMGAPRIAEASGIHPDVLRRLIWGKARRGSREVSKRISRATEAALLAVTWDPANGGPGIDAGPTIRRLRALYALGWYPSLLARETGIHRDIIFRFVRGDTRRGSGRVRPGTARRIHAVYRDLATRPAPTGTYAARTRTAAAERGWAPPLRVAGRVLAGAAVEMPEPREPRERNRKREAAA